MNDRGFVFGFFAGALAGALVAYLITKEEARDAIAGTAREAADIYARGKSVIDDVRSQTPSPITDL